MNHPKYRLFSMLLILILSVGCIKQKYLLVSGQKPAILIPPKSSISQEKKQLVYQLQSPAGNCHPPDSPLQLEAEKNRLKIIVTRSQLVSMPPGGLLEWAFQVQKSGCIAEGESYFLAASVADLFAFPVGGVPRLLTVNQGSSGYVDLPPGFRLRTISPIMKDGAEGEAIFEEAAETKLSRDGKFVIELKASPNLIGVEEALYQIQRRSNSYRNEIRIHSVIAKIGDQQKNEKQARARYFDFSPDQAVFRLFFLAQESNKVQRPLLLGARNEEILQRETNRLHQNPEHCTSGMIDAQCFVIPQNVAIIPFVAVSVNGQEFNVPIGTSLSRLIREDVRESPEKILVTLKVYKKYKKKLIPVQFSKKSSDIFSLMLQGGELIQW